jgi:two-component system, LytTR family, sensor kinase
MKWYYIFFALQTVICTLLAIYCLYRWNDLYKPIANTTFRNYCKVLTLTVIFYSAFMPGNLGWPAMVGFYYNYVFAIGAYVYVSIITVVTFFIYRIITKKIATLSINWQHIILFCTVAFVPFCIDIIGQQLVGYKGKTLITNISYSLLIGCCAAILNLFLINYSKKKEVALAAAENLAIKAELNALQAKINPHFLYNALSGLAGLALEDGRRASKMATALSHWFRYSLNKQERLTTTIAEEMEMVENYIAIEKIRFEDAIIFNIEVNKQAEHKTIPIFLIQPLVENTLKHAFKNMATKAEVTIRIQCTEFLSITVEDNGVPFAENMQMGYGLQSIYQKLQLLHPHQHEVIINNAPTKNITIFIYK